MLRRGALATGLLLAGVLLGCEDGAVRPRLWATDDMVRLTEGTPAAGSDLWHAGKRTVALFAAANETVSFQLILDAPPEGLKGLGISFERLAAPGYTMGEDAVSLFRMLPVQVGEYPPWYLRLADESAGPRRVYDILLPVGGPRTDRPITLQPNERLALWVDVAVPRDALPDEYAADILIRHRHGRLKAKLLLKVYDFVLPDIRPVPCLGGFSYKTIFQEFVRHVGPAGRPTPFVPSWLDTSNRHVRTGLVVLRELMRVGHQHRLDLFDRDIRPVLKRDRDGKVQLQWGSYDSVVKPYLDGTAFADRLGVAAWPAPAWSGWPDPVDYGGVASAAYRDTLAAVTARTVAHFRQLGAGEKLFGWLRTAPTGPACYARHAEMARIVRPAAGEMPLLAELPPTPPPESNWTAPKDFARLADMYAPPGNLASLASAGGLARRGRPLTGLYLRPGRPPYVGSCGVFSSPADVRALAWVAMKYRCRGIFLPETLHWEGLQAGAGPDVPAGGEDILFYPNPARGQTIEAWVLRKIEPRAAAGPAVLPSVRLKWLRRGLQDAAYLWLLRQRQRGAVADAMIRTMVHYAGAGAAGDHYQDGRLDGWVRAGPPWLWARKLLAEEVFAAIHPERVRREDLLGQRVAWQKLQQAACQVRIERIRTRFEVLAPGRYRAVLRAELYNELARPADVELRIASLPPGFRAVPPVRRLPKMPPGKRVVVELAAEGDHVRTGAAAKMILPVVLTTDLRGTKRLLAEVPFLMVGHIDRELTIDGSLRDWPMRPGNRAGEFRLLGRRGHIGGRPGLDQARGDRSPARRRRQGLAGRQSSVFALHDGRTLYLAFRCAEPAPQQMVARPTNVIRYQQLLASAEDLVEVIADPARSAKGPEGLYHLVVKCNGVMVSERGVGADPPLGAAGPWPVSAKVAIGSQNGFWIAELAIPLAAFGPGRAGPVWGVNFTRFATARAAGRETPRGAEASSWAGAARYYYHPENLGTMYLVPKEGRVRLQTTQPAGRSGQGE